MVVVSRQLCVDESVDVSLNVIGTMVMSKCMPSFKWILGDTTTCAGPTHPPTDIVYKTALCHGLLSRIKGQLARIS